MPVDKIFVKQQIDLLTAQAWFKQNKKLEKAAIDINVEYNLPCDNSNDNYDYSAPCIGGDYVPLSLSDVNGLDVIWIAYNGTTSCDSSYTSLSYNLSLQLTMPKTTDFPRFPN